MAHIQQFPSHIGVQREIALIRQNPASGWLQRYPARYPVMHKADFIQQANITAFLTVIQ